MINNPEFKKYAWVKFSKSVLTTVGVIFGLLALLLFDDDGGWHNVFTGTFAAIAFVSTCIWGVHSASNVYQKELDNKTWDFQKLIPLSSWRLFWGKILGVTSFSWCIGGVAAGLAYVGATLNPDIQDQFALLHAVFIFVLAGLGGQVTAALFTLFGGSQKLKRGSFVAFLIGVYAAHSIIQTGLHDFNIFDGILGAGWDRVRMWHGMTFSAITLEYMTIGFFLFWAIVGGHQLLREKLLYNDPPIAWMGFVLSWCLFSAGFFGGELSKFVNFYMFGLALLLTYVVMIFESDNLKSYSIWWTHLQNKNYGAAFERTPKWVASSAIVILWFVFATLTYDQDRGTNFVAVYMMTIILFLVRDGLVLHYFGLGRQGQSNRFALWAYYLLAYFILPWIVMKYVGISQLESLMPLEVLQGNQKPSFDMMTPFFPTPSKSMLVMVLPVTVEAIIAGLLLRNRLKTLER